MVLLESFQNMADASIVQGMLEANGIPSQLNDRNNVYVPIFGGVELYVRADDYERAKQLLKEHKE